MDKLCGLLIPARHIVENPISFCIPPDSRHILFLLSVLGLLAHKGWIAKNIRTFNGIDHVTPIESQGVVMTNTGRFLEWQADIILAELFSQ